MLDGSVKGMPEKEMATGIGKDLPAIYPGPKPIGYKPEDVELLTGIFNLKRNWPVGERQPGRRLDDLLFRTVYPPPRTTEHLKLEICNDRLPFAVEEPSYMQQGALIQPATEVAGNAGAVTESLQATNAACSPVDEDGIHGDVDLTTGSDEIGSVSTTSSERELFEDGLDPDRFGMTDVVEASRSVKEKFDNWRAGQREGKEVIILDTSEVDEIDKEAAEQRKMEKEALESKRRADYINKRKASLAKNPALVNNPSCNERRAAVRQGRNKNWKQSLAPRDSSPSPGTDPESMTPEETAAEKSKDAESRRTLFVVSLGDEGEIGLSKLLDLLSTKASQDENSRKDLERLMSILGNTEQTGHIEEPLEAVAAEETKHVGGVLKELVNEEQSMLEAVQEEPRPLEKVKGLGKKARNKLRKQSKKKEAK